MASQRFDKGFFAALVLWTSRVLLGTTSTGQLKAGTLVSLYFHVNHARQPGWRKLVKELRQYEGAVHTASRN